MASSIGGALPQGLWDKFLSWGEKFEKLTKILSPLYTLIIGRFGNLIPKEQFLIGGVLLYATLAGLLFILQRVIRPKSGVRIMPDDEPDDRRANGGQVLLTRIDWRWLSALIIYLIFSVAGFYFWIDREFLNKPPIINALLPQTAQLAPFHETSISVLAEDPEGGNLICKWTVSHGEIQPGAMDCTVAAIYKAPGTFGQQQIMVIVTDNKGKQAERKVIIDVRP